MKKIPSYPKITAKTNITVTQTQNININSPKNINAKKGFKRDSKKSKNNPEIQKNDSLVGISPQDYRKINEPLKKNSKKMFPKDHKPIEKQKQVRNSKSQRQLEMLSQKLKRLELKIKVLKTQEREIKDKHRSASNRSLSRNRESRDHSDYHKDSESKRKPKKDIVKLMQRNHSSNILKKSYSNKIGLKLIQKKADNNKKQKILEHISKTSIAVQNQRNKNRKLSQQEEHDAEILHKFVTQVPNSHPNLKQSIEQSLKKRTFELNSDDNSFESENILIEHPKNQYYISNLINSVSKPSLIQYREHLIQSLQTLHFLQKTRKPSPKEIQKCSVNLNHKTKYRTTIVLDLDQTLIHCNQTLSEPHDVKLNIKFPTGQRIDAGVNIRPYAQQFLAQLSQICEVIVFTASHQCYANVVLDYLDPMKKLVSHRLFRDHCWQTEEGIYIKDLRVMKNRKLDNILLVDNAAYSYYYQLENGIPIIPYYDDKSDRELKTLLTYIKTKIKEIETQDDKNMEILSLRNLNHNYFRLREYIKFEDIEQLIHKLYNSHSSHSFDSILTQNHI